MERARKPWLRGVITLGVIGVVGASLIASPVGAHLGKFGHLKKHIRQIARKVANQRINALVPGMITTVGDARYTALENVETFSTVLDANGATQTLATNGPLRLFARCTINDAGTDRVEVLGDSSVANWFYEDASTTAQPANTPVVLSSNSAATGTTDYDNDIDDTNFAVRQGNTIHYIGNDGEVLALGLNVFGHACYVSGVALKTTQPA